MGWYGWVPRFLKAHGSLILTVASGIGMIGTVILTAKQAPKAKKALDEESEDKIVREINRQVDGIPAEYDQYERDKRMDEICSEVSANPPELTIGERLRTAGPFYVPVILLGLGTLGCLAGAQILNAKQQAALVGMCAMLQKDFGAYRAEIRETYGEEADIRALTESRKKIRMLEEEVKRLEGIHNVRVFGISTIPGLIFRSDMAKIERAFLHFNRNLAMRGSNTLAELYEFLGIPAGNTLIEKPGEPSEAFGWNEYENEVTWGCAFVDYQLRKIETRNGEEVFMIDFPVPPYRIADIADFGDNPVHYDETEWDSLDHIYSGYLPQAAAELLQKGMETVPMLIDSATHTVDFPGMCVPGRSGIA